MRNYKSDTKCEPQINFNQFFKSQIPLREQNLQTVLKDKSNYQTVSKAESVV